MKYKLKNILISLPHDSIQFIACVLIILGMYFSRALMSIGMMTLIGAALLNIGLLTHLKELFKKPHLLLTTGYFLLNVLSFFWSENISYFDERIRIILPFLILPFSFLSINRWEMKWYDLLLLLFILANLLGISWSLYQYIQQKESYDIAYSYSKLIPTPFKNDHIRFSLSVVMSICFCVDLFLKYKKSFVRILLLFIVCIDILYIHILSAKTGIVAFYLVALIGAIQLFFSMKYKKAGVFSIFIIITLPFIMYFIFPSFKNKIGYFNYSLEQIKNDKKEANISDEGRIISYRYAIEIIKKNPLGVGLGDVYDEMDKFYKRDFKDAEVTTLLPHNQFLMSGVALGYLGIFYLVIMMISIFKLIKKNDFLYLSFCIIMLFTMMIEPLFETQYGTCLFLFFLLLLMKRSKYHLDSI
ncbi:MAG: O-antigen ligase family protein [Chitinophagaceae bacterium]|nr:O-antigen ligase family protein [Chitinophagaceae bacterium]